MFISDLVVKEIEDIGDPAQKRKILGLVGEFKTLSSGEKEIRALAEEYVLRGIIPLKHIGDAIHIAVASFYSLDILVSWNFEHIVKLKTKREVNVCCSHRFASVNVFLGYNQLEIIEPSML